MRITAHHRDRRDEPTIRDEEEEQQKDASAAEGEEAVRQVALRSVASDDDRSNTIWEDSFLGKGRVGE
jgi:hypothetical protein